MTITGKSSRMINKAQAGSEKDPIETIASDIKPWFIPTRSIAIRLFLTCWVIYGLHFAPNIVREIYPALALGDHFSFRVDEYANLHPDLFEKPGYGWHIGNNPGISMLAAIPYAMARPIIDPIVGYVNEQRAGIETAPVYDTPWPNSQKFYQEAWRRGFDIKFGLAAFVMHAFFMAPGSALAVIMMFFLLRFMFQSDKTAFWLSMLYAFGTPVFFRTGFLNHNLMLGHIAFAGLLVMWNPAQQLKWSMPTRYFIGGITGGTALLFDYSGLVFLGVLGLYGLISAYQQVGLKKAVINSVWFTLGSLGPICLLWWYQWRSFGHPLYPGQHWMPPVEWIELGYQGYGGPQLELLWMLAFDYRFGIFVVSPLMFLALLAPFFNRGQHRRLPTLELATMLGAFFLLWVFFSGSNYTRLQFNTGIRYMAPIFPFMFVPATVVLMRLPRWSIGLIVAVSLIISWPLAMYRDVEVGPGILNPIMLTLTNGLQLPVLNTLSRMGEQYGSFLTSQLATVPLYLLAMVILVIIWLPTLIKSRKNNSVAA
jgi:hypothetical protein